MTEENNEPTSGKPRKVSYLYSEESNGKDIQHERRNASPYLEKNLLRTFPKPNLRLYLFP